MFRDSIKAQASFVFRRRIWTGQEFLAQGGQGNSLKRLDPDKGIQGKTGQKFCSIWPDAVLALLDLAQFGFHLANADKTM
jgi:hypothetical protein